MMHLTRVLLPAPFSPSSAWTLPGSTRSDTSSRATKAPNRLLRPSASRRGGGPRRSVTSWTCAAVTRSSSRDRELGGLAREGPPPRARGEHDEKGEAVGRRRVEVVPAADADRLQRRADRARAAEEQRRPEASHRIPAREDDERHGHQALPAREALAPAAGVVERQERPADAREEPAHRRRDEAHAEHVVAEGARRIGVLAHDAHDQAPARPTEDEPHRECRRDAEQEEQVDLE